MKSVFSGPDYKSRPSVRDCLWRSRVIGLLLAVGLAPSTQANWLSSLTAPEIDIVAVTDMTDQGRAYPNASPEKPVYYMIVDAGRRSFGRSWAGDKVPDARVARKWMMTAMAQNGYRLADEAHPPTQLFVYGWGMLQGGDSRPALHFLGGDKLDIKWEGQEVLGPLGGHALTLARRLKLHGLAEKIWELSGSDLFLGVVRSYNIETANGGKVVQLWETRFACPSRGLYMVDAMPLMIKVAAANLGRESKIPVNVDASDEWRGKVELGEMENMGTEPDVPEHAAPSNENRKAKAK